MPGWLHSELRVGSDTNHCILPIGGNLTGVMAFTAAQLQLSCHRLLFLGVLQFNMDIISNEAGTAAHAC